MTQRLVAHLAEETARRGRGAVVDEFGIGEKTLRRVMRLHQVTAPDHHQ
jgi:hypothetical protein